MARSGFVYCPYERGDIPIEKCHACDRKETCPLLSGW